MPSRGTTVIVAVSPRPSTTTASPVERPVRVLRDRNVDSRGRLATNCVRNWVHFDHFRTSTACYPRSCTERPGFRLLAFCALAFAVAFFTAAVDNPRLFSPLVASSSATRTATTYSSTDQLGQTAATRAPENMPLKMLARFPQGNVTAYCPMGTTETAITR